MIVHCSAGKDRAGTCAVLILLALDIPEKTIIDDYELSNVYLSDWVKDIHEQMKAGGIEPDRLAPFFFAQRNYIVSLLNHIRNTYGAAADYLIEKAGVRKETLDILKRELLE